MCLFHSTNNVIPFTRGNLRDLFIPHTLSKLIKLKPFHIEYGNRTLPINTIHDLHN